MTGISYLAATALYRHLNNGGVECSPLRVNVPNLLREALDVLLEAGRISHRLLSPKSSLCTRPTIRW